jgi:hypothetical protein
LDIDDSEITVSQLIDRYLYNPEICFIKGYPEFNTNTNTTIPNQGTTELSSSTVNNGDYCTKGKWRDYLPPE